VAFVSVAALGVLVLSLVALHPGRGAATPSLPRAPSCSDKGEPSQEIEIGLEGSLPAFPQDCYYAPADQAFRIVFTNDLKALNSGVRVRANVSIYASQSEAVRLVDRGLQVEQSRAIFAGDFVNGPGSITYHIPPLSAGSYYMQSDTASEYLFASLVVVP
jgi:hypothetical protein